MGGPIGGPIIGCPIIGCPMDGCIGPVIIGSIGNGIAPAALDSKPPMEGK